MRDFMLTMNENINGLLDHGENGIFASRLETDYAI